MREKETHSYGTHGQHHSDVDTPRKTLTVPISIIYAPFLSIFYPHTHACTIMDLCLFVRLCEWVRVCVSLNGFIYGYSRCHKLYFVHTKHIRCCMKRLCKQISTPLFASSLDCCPFLSLSLSLAFSIPPFSVAIFSLSRLEFVVLA